jgi:hypothetical protein
MDADLNEKMNGQKSSEFDAPRWSVLSFEKCERNNLSYEEAQRFVAEMSDKFSGLCIVTDEAANRMCGSNGMSRRQNQEQSEDATKHFTETL